MDTTSSSPPPLRVLLYSHDAQGLGHVRRNLAVAHTLAASLPRLTGRAVTGLVVTGLPQVADGQAPDGFDVVVLPGIAKVAGRYAARRLRTGLDEVVGVRRSMLAGVLHGFGPDLVIVDRHPLGIDRELEEGLHRLRSEAPHTKVVLGLREVLDEPEAVAREWAELGATRVRELVDQVWVYGDQKVHDLRASGELPAALHERARFTGYLSNGRRAIAPAEALTRPFVLTMAGGGSDGQRLCESAAGADVPPGYRHVVVTGPQMPTVAHRAVQRAASARTTVTSCVPDGLAVTRQAAALVCMGGYNSVAEAMATDTPTLVVPREWPRREQLIRARSLAAVGALDVLRAEDTTPAAITSWWRSRVGQSCRRSGVDLGGLARLPRLAAQLLGTAEVDRAAG